MLTYTPNMLLQIKRLLPDTPENVPIYFFAMQGKGRFWLDNPKNPNALIASTGTDSTTIHLRPLHHDSEVDWQSLLSDIEWNGSLCGSSEIVRGLISEIGCLDPSVEVIARQQGKIRLTKPAAEKVNHYSSLAFEYVDQNAQWLWEHYPSVENRFEKFPAFAIFDQERIVAIAAVICHSFKWANIGYWVHSSHRLQGYATECAASLAAYLNERGVSATASTDETHLASLAVMRKLGMKESGRFMIAPKENCSK